MTETLPILHQKHLHIANTIHTHTHAPLDTIPLHTSHSKRPHLAVFHDLEALWDLADPSGKPGTTRDKAKEEDSLLVSELFQSLPQPSDQLVTLSDAIAIPDRGGGEGVEITVQCISPLLV